MCSVSNVGDGYRDTFPGRHWTVIHEEEIKAELVTREHVPNKIEAKTLRQKKAKAASRTNHHD